MNIVQDKTFDLERSLYNLKNTKVINCIFKGINDGESVLKEARNIIVDNCDFSLRYPLWHVETFELLNSKLDEFSRAPIWYSCNGLIDNVEMKSIKAVRECIDVKILNSKIISREFGWKSKKIELSNSYLESEYAFFDSKDVEVRNIDFKGKYSFQYIDGLRIEKSILDTKDAFWHSKNVLIKDSIVKGEYLAWFAENITFVNCKIIGTQPLCYCKNLKLIDCEMIDTDLAFEYSEVVANIIGHIDSIKNPKAGKIILDSIGKIIKEDSIMESNCKIIINRKDDK